MSLRLDIDLVEGEKLTGEHECEWQRIRASNSSLQSPFFSLAFTKLVSSVRNDVEVAVVRVGGECKAFFPFHRNPFGIGRPVGLGLSDYHGVIGEPSFQIPPSELLSACRLVRWDFDHLIADQVGLSTGPVEWTPSPIIRTEAGWDAYLDGLDSRGRKQFKESQRKLQKLSSEHGEVRFEEFSCLDSGLQSVMDWKSQQCRETGVTDYFSIPWIRMLMRKMHELRSDDCRGCLSSLYCGEQLIAAHFGMRTNDVLHFWFPGYSAEFSPYSPGLILLYRIIQSAADAGVKYIDLGKGVSTYKDRVMNDAIQVGSGAIVRRSIVNHLIGLSESLEFRSRQSSLHRVLSLPARAVRRFRRVHRFR